MVGQVRARRTFRGYLTNTYLNAVTQNILKLYTCDQVFSTVDVAPYRCCFQDFDSHQGVVFIQKCCFEYNWQVFPAFQLIVTVLSIVKGVLYVRVWRGQIVRMRRHAVRMRSILKDVAVAASLAGAQRMQRRQDEQDECERIEKKRQQEIIAEKERAAQKELERQQAILAEEERQRRQLIWQREQEKISEQHRCWLAEVGLGNQENREEYQGKSLQSQRVVTSDNLSDYSLGAFIKKHENIDTESLHNCEVNDQNPMNMPLPIPQPSPAVLKCEAQDLLPPPSCR